MIHLDWGQLHYHLWKTPGLGPRPCDRGDDEAASLPSTQPVALLYIWSEGLGIALSHTFSEAACTVLYKQMALHQAIHINLEPRLHSASHYQLIPELMKYSLLWSCVLWPGSPVSEEGLVQIPSCLLSVHLCSICRHFHLVTSILKN